MQAPVNPSDRGLTSSIDPWLMETLLLIAIDDDHPMRDAAIRALDELRQ